MPCKDHSGGMEWQRDEATLYSETALGPSEEQANPHQDMAGVVYSIPCKDCLKVYIGETGRQYGVREKEHMKSVSQLECITYTRTRKKESQTELHPWTT